MTIRMTLWLAFVLVLIAGLYDRPSAQSTKPSTPTQFQMLVLPPTGDPMTSAPVRTQTTSIGPTQNCGIDPATLPPPATGPVVNPLLFILDDPYTAGRVCRLSFPTGLEVGNYQWAGVLIADSCNPTGSMEIKPCPGPRSVGQPPFSIANTILEPPAPTGLRLLP